MLGVSKRMVISEQVRAARALIRWEQKDLALASGVSLPTIKRLETKPGLLTAHGPTLEALRRALEGAGIQFIPENGGGPGVRLRHPLGETRRKRGQPGHPGLDSDS
jgi:transcriptional regulator with XRE-family HTH domain